MTQTLMKLPESSESYRTPDEKILGNIEPRLYTKPLRDDLFSNETSSYGYKVIRFARDVLGSPLDDWQAWLVVRIGEYQEDNKTPRFRQVIITVARQNGKSFLLMVLALYWLLVEKQDDVLATNLALDYAKQSMLKTVELANQSPVLSRLILKPKEGNNDVSFMTVYGSRYTAKASTRRAGRGQTLNRVMIDEVREHTNWHTYDAAIPAMNAVPDAQAILTSNAGWEDSVVLNSLRDLAIAYIETGEGDESLGLFEWSAPDDFRFTSHDDPEMWVYANPNLGRRLKPSVLRAQALLADTGTQEMISFKTEYLSMRVTSMNPAIDALKWSRSADDNFSLKDYRDHLAMCLDVSPDRQHATLIGASVLDNDKAGVQFFREWSGADLLSQVRNDLPGLIDKYKPKVFGWLPGGPAAGLSTFLRERKKNRPEWARGVQIQEISADLYAACEGFAAEVSSMQIVHADDPLLNAQITGAEKKPVGDRWRFDRKGKGHVDAAYATAGAVLLARTLTMPDTTFMVF